MKFKEEPIGVKLGVTVGIVLPTIYVLILLATQDPDIVVFALGPFGFILFIVQWVAFLIGGWILAIIATIFFLVLIGYIFGRLLGWLVGKFRN